MPASSKSRAEQKRVSWEVVISGVAHNWLKYFENLECIINLSIIVNAYKKSVFVYGQNNIRFKVSRNARWSWTDLKVWIA